MWMSNLGTTLIISGIFVSLMYTGLKFIIDELAKSENITVSTPTNVLVVGIVEIVIGIGLIVARHILRKKVEEKNNQVD